MNVVDPQSLVLVQTARVLRVIATLPLLLMACRGEGVEAALTWRAGAGCRWGELPVPGAGQTGFELILPATTAIFFTNSITDQRAVTNQNLLNGSGVALGDVDGDGRCDVYLCRLEGNNKLFRNRGHWKFQDITDAAGVGCGNQDSTGAVFSDVDGDGDLDLLVNSMGGGTRVFENDGGGLFREVTARAGVASTTAGMSTALADTDGDGDLDLYVTNFRSSTIREEPNTKFSIERVDGRPVVTKVNGQPATSPQYAGRFAVALNGTILEFGEVDLVYRNDGRGHFTAVSFTNGGFFLDEDANPLTEPPRDWGLAVQFHDLNDDGAPDLYVCNDLFTPDRIWINDGQGRFRAIDRLALRNTSTFSMGVDFGDLNRDGVVDFVVVDMLSRDHRKRHVQIGETDPVRWPIGFIDNRPQIERNTLQLGRGDGTFAEIGFYGGVEASEWSWTVIFLDVDLDGFEDILVANGQLRDFQNGDMLARLAAAQRDRSLSRSEILRIWELFPRLETSKAAFRNRGNLTFEEVGAAWGFGGIGNARGMAMADLDGDGDLDLVVNNFNANAGVYRNRSAAPRVAVRLKGLPSNTAGIGAKIRVYGGAVPMQSQEVICGGRYLSSDDPIRVFAAGSLTNEMRIEVRWRSGKRSVVNGVRANRIYEIDEAGAEDAGSSKLKAQPVLRSSGPVGVRSNAAAGHGGLRLDGAPATAEGGSSREDPTTNAQSSITHHSPRATRPEESSKAQAPSSAHQPSTINHQPLFEDVSHLLNHTHHEEDFNDTEAQPLLPKSLSQLGPGVAWYDLDGDGWEDLIIGSGKGGAMAVYRNDGKGGFERRTAPPFDRRVPRDQTTVLAAESSLLAGSSNHEDGSTNGGCVRIYDLGRNVSGDSILGQTFSAGPLALADLDQDGDLDLFVGGRSVPRRYPQPAMSLVLRNEAGRLVVAQRLENVGLVSGAVFSDVTGDGQPDLVLACEWGPIRIFRNERDKLVPWDAPLTLNPQPLTINQLSGWWNGVTAGDLDGDGRLDLVASNWGLNSRYRTSREHPRKIYYGDLDGNGAIEVIEAQYEPAMKTEVPDRGLKAVGAALPWILEKVGTFEAYGKASLAELYGERLHAAAVVEVNTLETMVFLNRGGHFEARALPQEAQWAPAFGASAGDLDGDGKEDIFLSQNFFAVSPDQGRNDAGRGLWLRGDGQGNFSAVPGQESGIKVYGEQRGCALCDYDGDGRVDLVVTQNGAQTKLYHNVGARPGLRVRLRGPAGNSTAVGAVARLKFHDRFGPARQVHAGSGYWSQDSAVLVFGTPEPPTQIEVRWPGGQTTSSPVPSGAREIHCSPEGAVKVLK